MHKRLTRNAALHKLLAQDRCLLRGSRLPLRSRNVVLLKQEQFVMAVLDNFLQEGRVVGGAALLERKVPRHFEAALEANHTERFELMRVEDTA